MASLRVLVLFLTLAVATSESNVLILRHCPRAPYSSDRHPPLPPNNFTFADNFSAKAFPTDSDWGVPQGRCTVAGLKAVEQFGASLRAKLGLEGSRVVADSVQRCQDTAKALDLTKDVEVDQALFDPLSAKLPSCSQPDWQDTLEHQVMAMQAQLATARAELPGLQELLGKGVAPPLQQLPDSVEDGYLVGGLRVASELIVETFNLEQTSAMPVAWGKLSDEGLRDLLKLRAVYFHAMYGGFDIAQRYSSGLLDFVSRQFSQQADSKTVLTGHDTNIEGISSVLNLKWQCGSWPSESIPPLSGFLFTRSEGSVKVKALCHSFNGSDDPLEMGSAYFADGTSELPLAAFKAQVDNAILRACVNNTGRETQIMV